MNHLQSKQQELMTQKIEMYEAMIASSGFNYEECIKELFAFLTECGSNILEFRTSGIDATDFAKAQNSAFSYAKEFYEEDPKGHASFREYVEQELANFPFTCARILDMLNENGEV